MKFVTFHAGDGVARLGVYVQDGRVLDLVRSFPSNSVFLNMLSFIEAGEDAVELVRRTIRQGDYQPGLLHDEDAIKILAPIPKPNRNIYCVGLNYAEHSEEWTGNQSLPQFPVIFTKVPTTVIGTNDTIQSHQGLTHELDYEAELAVVLGKGGRDIPKEAVMDHIFGYTMVNDITARDLQRHHQQWFIGKSLDTFCPMGPYLIHKSSVPDPHQLNIGCKINGEQRQSSNTRNLIFDIYTIISTISRGHTFEAGDIIATGTCAGVGMSFNPPKYLKQGDLVEVEVEGLGILRNVVG
jgi:2-keto-4-pentenoate hydratase/2-oxohepta-3-ene-1,7-dioic acid hydratase in catechol pathway